MTNKPAPRENIGWAIFSLIALVVVALIYGFISEVSNVKMVMMVAVLAMMLSVLCVFFGKRVPSTINSLFQAAVELGREIVRARASPPTTGTDPLRPAASSPPTLQVVTGAEHADHRAQPPPC